MPKWKKWNLALTALERPLSSSSAKVFARGNNSLTFSECPEDSTAEAESEDESAAPSSPERPAPQRGNTMVHVCWHRNTSVSMVDFSVAVEVRTPHRPPSQSSHPTPIWRTAPHFPAYLFPFSVCSSLLTGFTFNYVSVGTVSSCAALKTTSTPPDSHLKELSLLQLKLASL